MDAFITVSVAKLKLPFSLSFSKNLLNIEKEKKLEKSGSLTSDDTTKLHWSRQYGTSTKKQISIRAAG